MPLKRIWVYIWDQRTWKGMTHLSWLVKKTSWQPQRLAHDQLVRTLSGGRMAKSTISHIPSGILPDFRKCIVIASSNISCTGLSSHKAQFQCALMQRYLELYLLCRLIVFRLAFCSLFRLYNSNFAVNSWSGSWSSHMGVSSRSSSPSYSHSKFTPSSSSESMPTSSSVQKMQATDTGLVKVVNETKHLS